MARGARGEGRAHTPEGGGACARHTEPHTPPVVSRCLAFIGRGDARSAATDPHTHPPISWPPPGRLFPGLCQFRTSFVALRVPTVILSHDIRFPGAKWMQVVMTRF